MAEAQTTKLRCACGAELTIQGFPSLQERQTALDAKGWCFTTITANGMTSSVVRCAKCRRTQ